MCITGTVEWRSNGHRRSLGNFELCAIMSPVASWVIVADVAVNVAVQPLLQKSAVAISERFRDLSEKTGTGIEIRELERIPTAADVMLSPLGSPTVIPTSGRMLSSKLESDSRKIVFVAPQSWMG